MADIFVVLLRYFESSIGNLIIKCSIYISKSNSGCLQPETRKILKIKAVAIV